MGYKSVVKIGATLTGLGLVLYTLYKNSYLILLLALTVGVVEAIDFYKSRMNPARMYTFKLLDWILKD